MSRRSGRQQLAFGLRQRRAEIEDALLTRAFSLAELPTVAGSEYAQGLRAAAIAALDYGIESIDQPEAAGPTAVPAELVAQARRAARSGIGLDLVLRRYIAGHTVFNDFIVSEAERQQLLEPEELKNLLQMQGALIESIVEVVAEAHADESGQRPSGTEGLRVEAVQRLLSGEPSKPASLDYGFEAWHIGLAIHGEIVSEVLRETARRLDRTALIIHPNSETTWVWLGGRRMVSSSDVLSHIPAQAGTAIGLGEPGRGLSGWRLTHRQATAGLCVARMGATSTVRYAEVALLNSVLGDEVLEKTLRQLYLTPLESSPADADLRDIARAYLETGFNVSSTAAKVGVERHTVSRRLRIVEERLGRSLTACASELNLALRLEELESKCR